MSKAFNILKYLYIVILFVLVSACAPAKKNPYYQKKSKSSIVGTEQLGRNRYYFSPNYQKKLNSTFKKKRER
jgi:hypothetical protein